MSAKVEEMLPEFMPAEEIDAFKAAYEAICTLAAIRKCDVLQACSWVYNAPFVCKKANYASYYGTKEVWTVTLEHPTHVDRSKKK